MYLPVDLLYGVHGSYTSMKGGNQMVTYKVPIHLGYTQPHEPLNIHGSC